MEAIKIRVSAKTDVGLVRTNNEDNFQIGSDLASDTMQWVNNQTIELGKKGLLMIVADGMGGMNAGEVASNIAVESIKQSFKSSNLTAEVLKNRFSIEKFMKSSIQKADYAIKQAAKNDSSKHGMGTTIVIAWIIDGQLYVSWCGDSRAYLYNQKHGLKQISKDHSYVQGLVDKGVISKEDAFDFPDSNIITRSLSDTGPKAIPDCLIKPIEVCSGDIILLCSDGLSGMIRDNVIEEVIANSLDNTTTCVDALIESALRAAGADNVTVAVAQIISGAPSPKNNRWDNFSTSQITANKNANLINKIRKKSLLFICAITVIALVILCCIFFPNNPPKDNSQKVIQSDTTTTVTTDTTSTHFNDSSAQGKPETKKNSTSESVDKNVKNPFENKGVVSTPEKQVQADDELNITDIPEKKDERKDEAQPDNEELYTYKVRPGENWSDIVRKFRIHMSELRQLNPNVGDRLAEGQEIKIRRTHQ